LAKKQRLGQNAKVNGGGVGGSRGANVEHDPFDDKYADVDDDAKEVSISDIHSPPAYSRC